MEAGGGRASRDPAACGRGGAKAGACAVSRAGGCRITSAIRERGAQGERAGPSAKGGTLCQAKGKAVARATEGAGGPGTRCRRGLARRRGWGGAGRGRRGPRERVQGLGGRYMHRGRRTWAAAGTWPGGEPQSWGERVRLQGAGPVRRGSSLRQRAPRRGSWGPRRGAQMNWQRPAAASAAGRWRAASRPPTWSTGASPWASGAGAARVEQNEGVASKGPSVASTLGTAGKKCPAARRGGGPAPPAQTSQHEQPSAGVFAGRRRPAPRHAAAARGAGRPGCFGFFPLFRAMRPHRRWALVKGAAPWRARWVPGPAPGARPALQVGRAAASQQRPTPQSDGQAPSARGAGLRAGCRPRDFKA